MWLRTAAKEDIDAIRELLVETWHTTHDDIIGAETVNQITKIWNSPDYFKKCLVRPSSEYVVADDGEELLGVAYAIQGAVKGAPDTVLLAQLYVRPKHQNQGVGERLLVELEESFPTARRCRVMVLEKSARAVHFYESHGYKKVGTAKPIAENPEIFEIAMEKELG